MNPHHNHENDDQSRGEHCERNDGEFEGPARHGREGGERDELVTVAEVAKLLRVSPATVRYWRHEHKGPRSFRIGRHVRYRRTDVLNWIARQINNGSGDTA